MVEKEIVEKIKEFVKKLREHGITVAQAVLYGSRACGKARQNSDIDVAVVSEDFGKDPVEEGMLLFQIACEIDPRIEPVPISVESYENDTWIPLIYEIRQNGIALNIR